MKYLLLISLILLSLTAKASYFCIGTIEDTIIYANGDIAIISNEMFGDDEKRIICNLDTPFKNISVESCKILSSKVMAKHVSQSTAKIQYTDDVSCETQLNGQDSSRVYSIH